MLVGSAVDLDGFIAAWEWLVEWQTSFVSGKKCRWRRLLAGLELGGTEVDVRITRP